MGFLTVENNVMTQTLTQMTAVLIIAMKRLGMNVKSQDRHALPYLCVGMGLLKLKKNVMIIT